MVKTGIKDEDFVILRLFLLNNSDLMVPNISILKQIHIKKYFGVKKIIILALVFVCISTENISCGLDNNRFLLFL